MLKSPGQAFNNKTCFAPVASQKPELQFIGDSRPGALEIDQKFQVRCIARDGRPAAKLSWFLDNEPITDNLSSEQPTESLASNNQTLYTATQTLTRYIRAGDDHKRITCRATAAGQVQDVHLQLQVKCEYSLVENNQIYNIDSSLTCYWL